MSICKDCKFFKVETEEKTVNGLAIDFDTYKDMLIGDETKRFAQCSNPLAVLDDVTREAYSAEIMGTAKMVNFQQQTSKVVVSEDDVCPLFELP